MSAITLMADIVILNMFLVVACLPVVTAGAAVRAASVVVRDIAAGVGSGYSMQFLRELTQRWKPVTLYWLLLIALGAALRRANHKFERRFRAMEAMADADGQALRGAVLPVGVRGGHRAPGSFRLDAADEEPTSAVPLCTMSSAASA